MTETRVSVILPSCWDNDYVLFLDTVLSLPLRELVFAGFLCFCRNFASIWQISPAICTSAARIKPATEPTWGSQKDHRWDQSFFSWKKNTMSPARNSNIKPNQDKKQNKTKTKLYYFRTNTRENESLRGLSLPLFLPCWCRIIKFW